MRIFSDAGEEIESAETETIYGAEVDGEVAITIREFPIDNPLIDEGLTPSEPEIEATVRTASQLLSDGSIQVASRPLLNPDRFDFELAKQPETERYAIRIVPENVSYIAKTDETEEIVAPGLEEKFVKITRQTFLARIVEGTWLHR